MCYILLLTSQIYVFLLHTRHIWCSHAEVRSFDPLTCPNRTKRCQQSRNGVRDRCTHRRGSLSCLPMNKFGDSGREHSSKQAGKRKTSENKASCSKDGKKNKKSREGAWNITQTVRSLILLPRLGNNQPHHYSHPSILLCTFAPVLLLFHHLQ